MSWASAFWKRNSNAIQSIAKPFIGNIPLVGGVVASRINMSPTDAQQQLAATTQAAMTNVAAQASTVQAEQDRAAQAAIQLRQTATPMATPTGAAPAGPFGSIPPMLVYGGLGIGALLLVLKSGRH